jgi:hypothetical protein
MHAIDSSCTWFIYNLNTKHCYSQVTYKWHYVHMRIRIVALFNSACTISPPVYLLGDPSSFARGANTHPLSSLVSYQLFSPCCLTHPGSTPQIKLHIYIDNINNISCPVWYVQSAKDTFITPDFLYSSFYLLVITSSSQLQLFTLN